MARVLISPEVLESARAGREFDLDEATTRHLVRVLRLTPGETFFAFDGRGGEWECALASPGADEVDPEATARPRRRGRPRTARAVWLEPRPSRPESRLRLSVAQAIPKGDKLEWVLQKGTELGVAEFWPFTAEHSVPRWGVADEDEAAERARGRTERWQRIVDSAAGQCGALHVPVVHAPADFSTVIGVGTNSGRCFMLDEAPGLLSLRASLRRQPLGTESEEAQDRPVEVMVVVGPEGGWDQAEREQAERYGVEAVSLGSLILRTETAALVACAVLQWEAGALE